MRAEFFASFFLLPPALLKSIPAPDVWNDEKTMTWSLRLQVSAPALPAALVRDGFVDRTMRDSIKRVRAPKEARIDPELPEDLAPSVRARREELLKRGLSLWYVNLCFGAFEQHHISAGRLAEALLVHVADLSSVAETFKRPINHAD